MTGITLEDGGPAAGPGQDQVAHHVRRRRVATTGEKEQVHRRRERGTVFQPDHRAVGHEGGVEVDERRAALACHGEVAFEHLRIGLQRLRERRDPNAGCQCAGLGEVGPETPVDEDQQVRRRTAQHEAGQIPAGNAVGRRRRGPVDRLRERAQVGVLEGLDLRRGESRLGEARQRPLAVRLQPGEPTARQARLDLGELIGVRRAAISLVSHSVAPTSGPLWSLRPKAA
jgi:hypothetical protein